jgi:hypothetical protein
VAAVAAAAPRSCWLFGMMFSTFRPLGVAIIAVICCYQLAIATDVDMTAAGAGSRPHLLYILAV